MASKGNSGSKKGPKVHRDAENDRKHPKKGDSR